MNGNVTDNNTIVEGIDVPWLLSPDEMKNISLLAAPDRYCYFVKKIVDQEQLWSLWNDGWALAGDDHSNEAIPVWPHEQFASLCATGAWKDFVPKVISLVD